MGVHRPIATIKIILASACVLLIYIVTYKYYSTMLVLGKLSTSVSGGFGSMVMPDEVMRMTEISTNCSLRLAPYHSIPLIALTSIPGSGNTWTRHLLQVATGIYTGNMRTSHELYNAGFFGDMEDYANGTTLTLKTHQVKLESFEGAVLLLRDPHKAILAEFNRRVAGKTQTTQSSQFKTQEWKDIVRELGERWYKHTMLWLAFTKPLHIVKYAELKRDTLGEVRKMLSFLGLNLTLARKRCLLDDMNGQFKRTGKKSLPTDPFTKDMHQVLDYYMNSVNEVLSKMNLSVLEREE